MKQGKITFHAADSTMGDSTPGYCNGFRKYAKQQMIDRYGDNFDIEISTRDASDETYVKWNDAETYDGTLEDQIKAFANRLWDDFGRLSEDEYEQYI